MGGDEVCGLADREYLGRVLVGDAYAVAVLELHDELHEVERVGLEILLEASAVADAAGIDLQLGCEVLADALEDRFAGHSGATLAVGTDLNAPAASSASAVRSTMRWSTARRASRTAAAIPSGPKLPCATTTGRRSPSRIAPPTRSGSSCSRRAPSRRLMSSPPALDTAPERIASRMAPVTALAVPSMAFSATLPVKPSVTTTSTLPPARSKPSTLPAKLRPPAASRSPASSTSDVPLPDSSPTDSNPTCGRSTPKIGRASC